jgi:hypothetical protein
VEYTLSVEPTQTLFGPAIVGTGNALTVTLLVVGVAALQLLALV